MNGEVRDREKVMKGLKSPTHRYLHVIRFSIITSEDTKGQRVRPLLKLAEYRSKEKTNGWY